jgi:chemotaxis protein methyltransferase CheR
MFEVCHRPNMIDSLDFSYLRHLVRKYSAIVLDENKEYLAELHLGALAESAGFDSLASLASHLREQPFGRLHEQAIEALVTYETSFFRDIHPFEALKSRVLPNLIEQRKETRSFNIWCAACSSGQEPYSIAMLMHEHFPMFVNSKIVRPLWNVRLIASDFSSRALTRARQGYYSHLEIKRGLSPALRDKYFQQQGNGWRIESDIRQMVDFRQINLIDSWASLPKMDLIFLRNVLIYFDTDTKKAILAKVRQLLKPDGYLFLGGSETTMNLDDSFDRVQFGKSVYHQPQ